MDLTSKAMIATLSMRGFWSAVGEDQEASQELARQKNISADLYRAMKKIVDPKKVPSLKELNSARATLYNLHRQLTLAWDDKGGRMLPAAMYFEYMQKIGDAKLRVIEKYEAFLLDIPTLKAKFQTDPETAGAYSEEDWPNPAELRDKVDIRVRITPLADAADFRVSLGAEEEAKIKAQVEHDLYSTLATSLAELIGRIKQAVLDTQERLANYQMDPKGKVVKTFRDSAITNLRELVALIPKLNVMGDPTINGLAQEIQSLLCQRDPQDLRDNYLLRKQAVMDAGSIAAKLASIEQVLTPAAA